MLLQPCTGWQNSEGPAMARSRGGCAQREIQEIWGQVIYLKARNE